jgi:protein gp37
MADETKISWAHSTLNFWIGCTKVSAACDGCYAERDWDHRKHRVEWGPHGDRSPTKTWGNAARWQRQAETFHMEHGCRRRVFVNSLSDFFDNHRSIDPSWRAAAWQIFRDCPDLDFLLLTKRPQNIAKMLPDDWGKGYPNVWLGTTVENQEEADRRVPVLLGVPAALRWLSCEPLLGPVDLRMIHLRRSGERGTDLSNRLGDYVQPLRGNFVDSPKIHWVIAGGESGPDARPMPLEWALQLSAHCAEAGTAFHFKQLSEADHPRSFRAFDSFPADLQVREVPHVG